MSAEKKRSRHDQSVEDARLTLHASLGDRAIRSLPIEDLEGIEIAPGVKLGHDIVELPAAWMPAGRKQTLSQRSWRWDSIATDRNPVGSPGYTAARAAIMAAALALWLIPQEFGRGHGTKRLKSSTFIPYILALVFFTRELLGGDIEILVVRGFFDAFSEEQFTRAARAAGKAYSNTFSSVFAALDRLLERNILRDWRAQKPALAAEPNEHPLEEQPKKNAETPTSDPDSQRVWVPLPDEFVSETGWRVLWVIENLGPRLIMCLERMTAQGLLGNMRRHQTLSMEDVQRAREDIISSYPWAIADGKGEIKIPFIVRVGGRGKTVQDMNIWSPSSYAVLVAIARLLQQSHLFVVALTLGARWSELASLRRDCLVEDTPTDGGMDRVQGKTYKLSDNVGGAVRDWPLHPIAVSAIQQQVRLARALAPDIDELWVAETRKGEGWIALHSAESTLAALVKALGLTRLLGEKPCHSHRFRKTVARLAALALVGAPKILMDLFGHRTIEMTLRYILSDPGIAAEIQAVAQGMVIALGKDAISAVNDNTAGGPAAASLHAHLQVRVARLGIDVFGSESIAELAEILTANGRAVALVRPGVLCTKVPGQAGPCTKRVGHPDPSRCKTDCDHRLELAAARQDAERAIEQCVAFLRDPATQGSEEMTAFWLGQIRSHVKRLTGLASRLAAIPEIAAVLGTIENTAA